MRALLLPVGAIALVVAALLFAQRQDTSAEADGPEKVERVAPEFTPGAEWLQSKPLTMASLRGRVVVVHFWTFGCINCIHNYPAYKGWQKQFADKAVTLVGIHTPESKGEADPKRVRARAEENDLKFPILLDNDGQNWRNWKNRYWPSVYLIDKKGQVRFRWEGELDGGKIKGEDLIRRKIDDLLAEKE